MKPAPLRTCVRRPRQLLHPSRPAAVADWRPLLLCWPRRPARVVPGVAQARSRANPQPHHTSVHLHFVLPAAPAAPPTTGSSARLSSMITRSGPADREQLPPRQFMLQRLHPLSAVTRRELVHASSQLRERVRMANVSSTVVIPIQRITSMVIAKGATLPIPPPRVELAGCAMYPARATETRPPTVVPREPAPRRGSRRAAPFAHVFEPPMPLVWRKSEPPIPEPAAAAGGAASPTATPVATPAMRNIPPAAPAYAPQQVREAVRANLLDGAVADRLADDVIRRVEKRLRIERERRGL